MNTSLKELNKKKRSIRMGEANLKGSHTKGEWNLMKLFFEDTCGRCFGENGLNGVVKDHILPIYMGGSNGLDNIQPLCAKCNASKGSENFDYRPSLAIHLSKNLIATYCNKQVIPKL